MNENFKKDLEIIYDYFENHIYNKRGILGVDELGNPNYDYGEFLYSFIVDYYEYNKFPVVIKTKEFNKLEFPAVYHGFREYDHGANFLSHWKYHYGTGYISGLYASRDKNEALFYTGGPQTQDDKLILPIKLNIKKIVLMSEIQSYIYAFLFDFKKEIRDSDLIQECNNFIDKANHDQQNLYCNILGRRPKVPNLKKYDSIKDIRGEKREKIQALFDLMIEKSKEDAFVVGDFLFNNLLYNASCLTVLLGESVMIDDTFNDLLLIHDRGSVIVPEKDAKRFLKKSENYRDAVLNFYDSLETEEKEKY